MALDKKIYKEFEAIVGKDNISDDRGVRAAYQCIPAQSSDHRGPFPGRTPLPDAVILPGSTEEVQKIIKLCNKYKIPFKASSTFWSTMGYIGDDGSIQMDMRRMNKFEIDAKNMYIICEPWVIGATAQAEAMKYGLNLNIPGVGCSSSPVASTSSWVGFGPQTIFMGAATENLLGCEWVLPDGEVLRTGSLGAGSGWFCGEGPGPSIRGILRGKQGTAGSFGVCTRMAVRLHPWPGPTYIPSYGTIPAYKADLPDNFKAYTLCFPDWDAYAWGLTYLHQAEILYLGHRQFTMFGRDIKTGMLKILNDPDGQLADLEGYVQDPELKKINEDMKIDIQVIIAGFSKKDLEYKEAVLKLILDKVGGWTSKWMGEKEMENYTLMYLLRLGHKNLNFVIKALILCYCCKDIHVDTYELTALVGVLKRLESSIGCDDPLLGIGRCVCSGCLSSLLSSRSLCGFCSCGCSTLTACGHAQCHGKAHNNSNNPFFHNSLLLCI